MTKERIAKLKRILQEARYAICIENEDFGLPLYDMHFVAVSDIKRISTNGTCIYINPGWLQKIPPVSVEFMLAHQLLHISLCHINRPQYFTGERYHLACDIIANSFLRELGYTYDSLPGIGKLFHETFFPRTEGKLLTVTKAFRQTPFDPAALTGNEKEKYLIDSELYWGRKSDCGECGIILLSPEDEEPEDLNLYEKYSAKQNKLTKKTGPMQRERSLIQLEKEPEEGQKRKAPHMTQNDANSELRTVLDHIRYIKRRSELSAAQEAEQRFWQKPNTPNIDWKSLLDVFIQEEVCDYTFLPPDRRLTESEFFLPDYRESPPEAKEVLFAVDTSGSIDDTMLTTVYGEIEGALEQFNGMLSGVIAFFDTRVYGLHRFTETEVLHNIVPVGGGGTDFSCLFSYLKQAGYSPSCIIVFTDGHGEFPDESLAMNIPVLWLLSRQDNNVPWGQCAKLKTLT